MAETCVQLINRILAGDEEAFGCLIQRYQKRVHALAWRKIGDYHIAEEITQDTFLRVYQKLSSLRNPKQFDGWLYVITDRLCINWVQRHKSETQSIEDLSAEVLEESFYTQYKSEVREKENTENYQAIVKKLLEKLPESECTVVTLYYMGEMTAKEIGNFLGVSANTIKSRLQRARNRLKQDEPMIREAISHHQISPMLTENILRKVTELKPAAPSASKPFVPWVIGTSAVIVIVLMLGIGNKNLTRVQQPYSLDAESEMMVDIVEAPIEQNMVADVDTRTQIGVRSGDNEKDDGNGGGSNLNNGDKQNYSQWNLPEHAKIRLGKGRTNDIEFSADGNRFAVASPIGIWVYDARTGKELSLLKKPGQGISAIAFSPDSKIIAGASSNRWGGKIQLWDVASEKLLATIEEVQQGITTLFFSADGTKIASTGIFGHVHVWDIRNRLNPHVIRAIRLDNVKSWGQSQLAELSPDMRFLAITIEDWKNKNFPIQLWDATSGEHLYTLTGHSRLIKSITFSPDSKTLISGDEYESIRMWDTETGNLISTMNWQRGSSTYALMISPNGSFLASGHRNHVLLWNNTKQDKQENGDMVGDYQKKIEITEHKDYLYNFTFSQDEKTLLTASKDGTIRAWDTSSGEENFVCTGHTERINGLVLSETGDTLTTYNQPINPPGKFHSQRWDIKTGTLFSTDYLKVGGQTTLAISPDDKILAVHYIGGKCVLRDAETESLEVISRFSLEGFPKSGLNVRFAFSQDSKMLAAGGEDGSVHVWKIKNKSQSFIGRLASGFKTMHIQFKANGHSKLIRALAFSPDSQILATGGRDKTIRLWNVADGSPRHTLTGHSYRVDTLAFSPDGKTLASGNDKLHLWDVETGTELNRILVDKRFNIDTLLFSPDGFIIIMAGSDGINLYDTRSGLISNLHLGITSMLKFSTDSKTLMSVERSGSVLFWDWNEIAHTP